MTIEDNKEVARRWVRAFDAEDLEALAALCADDFAFRQMSSPIDGVEGCLAMARRVYARWQPHRLEIEDQIAEGDRVVLRMTAHDTQIAPYLGLPASGAALTWAVTFIFRIENGRVAEIWRTGDDLARVRQCGGEVVARKAI